MWQLHLDQDSYECASVSVVRRSRVGATLRLRGICSSMAGVARSSILEKRSFTRLRAIGPGQQVIEGKDVSFHHQFLHRGEVDLYVGWLE